MRGEKDTTTRVHCDHCGKWLVLDTDQVAIIVFDGALKTYLCFDCYENEAALNDSSGG